MAYLFDQGARLDTLISTKLYFQMTEAYENGAVSDLLWGTSLSEEERVDIVSSLSRAYFKSARFQKALDINQEGLDRMGKTAWTSNFKFNRAYIHKYTKHPDRAEQEYKDIVNEFPASQNTKDLARVRLVKVLANQQKNQEARSHSRGTDSIQS